MSDSVDIKILPPVALDASPVAVSSMHAAGGIVTYKIKIPYIHWEHLDQLAEKSLEVVECMLKNRGDTSTKFYKELPSIVAKGLSAKYQKNEKCKSISHLVIPICGDKGSRDKGSRVKVAKEGIRIPALFKKAVIPCEFKLPVSGFIRSIECFKRQGEWFMSYTYNTECAPPVPVTGFVGVDRNSVGNVAVMADLTNGHVRQMGFNPARTKMCWRNRKRKLQAQGKRRLLRKLRKKQERLTKYQNHVVSKTVVDYAKLHSRAIVIEKLENVTAKTSKIRSYSERNQWAFAQLAQFIDYKARLAGVTLIAVDPAFTSQTCSRCGSIHKPDGKAFRCTSCGHQDHRDSNSSFVIAQRGERSYGGLATDSVRRRCGLIDSPRSEK